MVYYFFGVSGGWWVCVLIKIKALPAFNEDLTKVQAELDKIRNFVEDQLKTSKNLICAIWKKVALNFIRRPQLNRNRKNSLGFFLSDKK